MAFEAPGSATGFYRKARTRRGAVDDGRAEIDDRTSTIRRSRKSSFQSVRKSVRQNVRECANYWSEWQDLNLRPPRPERGALPPLP
jgi:hypothetical protein